MFSNLFVAGVTLFASGGLVVFALDCAAEHRFGRAAFDLSLAVTGLIAGIYLLASYPC